VTGLFPVAFFFHYCYNDSSINFDGFYGGFMPDVKFSTIQCMWIGRSILLQIASLKRSIAKEPAGSELSVLRNREIGVLNSILDVVRL